MRARRNFLLGTGRYEVRFYSYGKDLRPDEMRRLIRRGSKKDAIRFAREWGDSEFGDIEVVDRDTGAIVVLLEGSRRYNPRKKRKTRVKRRSSVAMAHSLRGAAGSGVHSGSRRSRKRAIRRGSSRKRKHRLRRNPDQPYLAADRGVFEATLAKERTKAMSSLRGISAALTAEELEDVPGAADLRPVADQWAVVVASAAYPELDDQSLARMGLKPAAEYVLGLDPASPYPFFAPYRKSHSKVFGNAITELTDRLKSARKSARGKRGAGTVKVRAALQEIEEREAAAAERAVEPEYEEEFGDEDELAELERLEALEAGEAGEEAQVFDIAQREAASEARREEDEPLSLVHRPRQYMGDTAARRLGEFAHHRSKRRRRDITPPPEMLAAATEDILLFYLQDGSTQVWAKRSLTETFLPHKRTPSYKIATKYANRWRGLDDRGKLMPGAKKSRMRSRVVLGVQGNGTDVVLVSPAIVEMEAAVATKTKMKVKKQTLASLKKDMGIENPRRRRGSGASHNWQRRPKKGAPGHRRVRWTKYAGEHPDEKVASIGRTGFGEYPYEWHVGDLGAGKIVAKGKSRTLDDAKRIADRNLGRANPDRWTAHDERELQKAESQANIWQAIIAHSGEYGRLGYLSGPERETYVWAVRNERRLREKRERARRLRRNPDSTADLPGMRVRGRTTAGHGVALERSNPERRGKRYTGRGQRGKERQDSVGKAAYERRAQGLSWEQVAVGTGSRQDTITKLAKRYAEEHGKPWPVSQPPACPLLSRDTTRRVRGRKYYQFMVRHGVGPTDAARCFGTSNNAVTGAAKAWAMSEGREWPIPRKGYGERAYLLRWQGLTWDEAAEGAGYARRQGAVEGARRYAQSRGLKWPPPDPRRGRKIRRNSRR